MDKEEGINPHLADVFRTALERAKPAEAEEPPPRPSIVVNGSGNVLSWGGTVYVRDLSSSHGEVRG